MTRQAELKARDFVALVERGISSETEVGVVQRLLLQAQTAIGSYADPAWAEAEGAASFANRLLELAREAEAGSDHQLAFVNALTGAALSRGTPRYCANCSTPIPPPLGSTADRRHGPALAHRRGTRGRR